MKKCGYCGRENDDTLAVCSECGVELAPPPVPEIERQLTDPALSLVVVATFSSLQEASLLVARLEAAGIEACIPEEYGAQVFSAVIPLDRLTVRVAAKDYEAAKAIITEDAGREPTPAPASFSESKQDNGQGGHSDEIREPESQQTESGKLCSSCGTPIPPDSMTCPRCGWTQPPIIKG
jgi:Putative prokaryotic signal transducing protein/zinc-ribbon domain